jgi:hypothetical protein
MRARPVEYGKLLQSPHPPEFRPALREAHNFTALPAGVFALTAYAGSRRHGRCVCRRQSLLSKLPLSHTLNNETEIIFVAIKFWTRNNLAVRPEVAEFN